MKKVSLLLVVVILASSTGLLLAIHLHQEGCEHDSHHCELCIALVYAPLAVVEPSQVIVALPIIERPVVVPAESAPCVRIVHGPFASRAPPSV